MATNGALLPRGRTPDPRRYATVRGPWAVDAAGRTAGVAGPAKVRQFLEAYLFTAPGERVNRPNFGVGAPQLVFAGVAQVEQTLRQGISGGLAQELLDLIEIVAVDSERVESAVRVTVRYRLLQPGQTATELRETFDRPVAG